MPPPAQSRPMSNSGLSQRQPEAGGVDLASMRIAASASASPLKIRRVRFAQVFFLSPAQGRHGVLHSSRQRCQQLPSPACGCPLPVWVIRPSLLGRHRAIPPPAACCGVGLRSPAVLAVVRDQSAPSPSLWPPAQRPAERGAGQLGCSERSLSGWSAPSAARSGVSRSRHPPGSARRCVVSCGTSRMGRRSWPALGSVCSAGCWRSGCAVDRPPVALALETAGARSAAVLRW